MIARGPWSFRHFVSVALVTGSVLLMSGEVIAQSMSVSASAFSEPVHLGLSESDGRPGVSATVDWELNDRFFAGVSAYRTSSARAPNRTENLTAYAGVHWGNADAAQFDLALIHRSYPGDFVNDWDYTELRLDVAVTPSLGLTVSAADDFYGLGSSAATLTGRYLHDWSERLFTRIEVGHVAGGAPIEDYSFAVVGAGFRHDRLTAEVAFRANDAKPFPGSAADQQDNRFMLTLSWLVY